MIRITVAVENRPSPDGDIVYEHGLSLCLEREGQKWLFDTGASGAVVDNLQRLGIPAREITGIVVSHAHNDHAGGLAAVLAANAEAPVYLSHRVRGLRCFSLKNGMLRDISFDRALFDRYPGRFVYTDGDAVVGEGMRLLADVGGNLPLPAANSRLTASRCGMPGADDFGHEVSLVVRDGTKTLLVAGCAHRGILNIIETCRVRTGNYPDAIVGGCHFPDGSNEDDTTIRRTAAFIAGLPTRPLLVTGHCTGDRAAALMKGLLGDRMVTMHAGLKFTV